MIIPATPNDVDVLVVESEVLKDVIEVNLCVTVVEVVVSGTSVVLGALVVES